MCDEDEDLDPVRRDFERAAKWLGSYCLIQIRGVDGRPEYLETRTQNAWELWQICAAGVENTDCP